MDSLVDSTDLGDLDAWLNVDFCFDNFDYQAYDPSQQSFLRSDTMPADARIALQMLMNSNSESYESNPNHQQPPQPSQNQLLHQQQQHIPNNSRQASVAAPAPVMPKPNVSAQPLNQTPVSHNPSSSDIFAGSLLPNLLMAASANGGHSQSLLSSLLFPGALGPGGAAAAAAAAAAFSLASNPAALQLLAAHSSQSASHEAPHIVTQPPVSQGPSLALPPLAAASPAIPPPRLQPAVSSPSPPSEPSTPSPSPFSPGLPGSASKFDKDSSAEELDKRRRNTAASARFRAKKKVREQVLERTAKDMAAKADALEKKVKEYEMEIKWLRQLVTDRDGSKRLRDVYEENGLVLMDGTFAAPVGTESLAEGVQPTAPQTVSAQQFLQSFGVSFPNLGVRPILPVDPSNKKMKLK